MLETQHRDQLSYLVVLHGFLRSLKTSSGIVSQITVWPLLYKSLSEPDNNSLIPITQNYTI